MIRQFVTLVGFVAVVSCHDGGSGLEEALEKSGSNRYELEQVLSYFSGNPKDSLKLKAAYFLIENMPGHVTLEGKEISENAVEVERANGDRRYFERKVFKMLPLRFDGVRCRLTSIEDVKSIKSDFLIHHIEKSFEVWQSLPWLKSLDFDGFCEYLLPYRAEEERLDHWRDSVACAEEVLMNIVNHYDDLKYSITSVSNFMMQFLVAGSMRFSDPARKSYCLDCVDLSLIKLFQFRSMGIPCAIDYVPSWSGTNGAHHWLRVIDPIYKNGGVPQVYQRTAKIYRRTFSRNEMPEDDLCIYLIYSVIRLIVM